MIRSTWYHKGKRALSLHCASGLFFRVSPHIRLRVCSVLQWEALRLQLSMQRGLARRGRPERAMRTGDANVSNMVGAAGLEPARPKSRDFKSPASANSATPPDMSSYYATTFNSARAKLAAKSQATAFPGERQLQLPPGQRAGHSRLLPGV